MKAKSSVFVFVLKRSYICYYIFCMTVPISYLFWVKNIHLIISFSRYRRWRFRIICKISGFSFLKYCHCFGKTMFFVTRNQQHFHVTKVPCIKIHKKYSFLRVPKKMFLCFVRPYYEFISFLLLHTKLKLAKSLRTYFDTAHFVLFVVMFMI